ncbi:SMI1/KNR4 family protein [Streptococcus panodentis]|uniref:SMI1/KNR4 family protein n=1 Tax=Streptococcus panodentis TaxID=1581472 RepID=A0ABS5AYS2_9STRE|nr:SMI1/KNR4 family protein [Streptococcus panodentis]MBP2621737.1 SMI1/KNR4 family protein [Streptococcus panodentis]
MNSFSKVTSEQISAIEKRLKLEFPNDYKQFLLTNNGLRSRGDFFFHLVDIDFEVHIDILYGIDTGVKNCDLIDWTEKFRFDLPPQAIIIGDDIIMGFIVLILSEEDGGIYYYDHAYNLDTSNDDNNAYFIADNFTDFLAMLHE